MISILSRYLAQEFLRFFLLFLLAFLAITLLGNLVENINDAFSGQEGLLRFLRQTALLLPLLLELTLPVTVLLATIAAFSALSRTSEIVAMRASGVGPQRLVRPVLGVATVIAIAGYVTQHYAQPWMQTHWSENAAVGGRPSQWKLGGERQLFYFGARQADGVVETLASFGWIDSPSYHLEQQFLAQHARASDEAWELQRVQQRVFASAALQFQAFDQERRPLNTIPAVSFDSYRNPHHIPLGQLWDLIGQRRDQGLDVTAHWVEFFQKLAYPAHLFVMIGIGMALSATHHRQTKAAESLAIAVFIGVMFWILNQILLAVGHAGALPAWFAAWGTNLLFAGVAVGLLWWKRT
jgi:LPS export ABC transporter permease LptG